jgi:tripartite-type tricarboxylate transporter receptor subunit TctC
MVNRRQLIAVAGATLVAGSALAQVAGRPVRLLVGFAPGGSVDTLARLLSTHLKLDGAGPIIVENQPGAGGRLAIDTVKRAAADGNTILLTPAAMMMMYPHVYQKLSYDPERDFKAVTPLVSLPYAVSVGPMVPESVKTLRDLVGWFEANPKAAAYGTPGAGTAPHFLGVMLGQAWNVDYVHVPYRGGAPAIQEVMGGQIAGSINVLSEVVQPAKAGKLRVLAVSSPERSKLLPDVPTMREAGYPKLESQEWFGLFLPKAADDGLVKRIQGAAANAVIQQSVTQQLNDMGFDVFTASPPAFQEMLAADIKRWGPVVKSTGYSINE